jgi:hypothetical protein
MTPAKSKLTASSTSYDTLATHISAMSARSDELVASLYPPQNESTILEEVKFSAEMLQQLKEVLTGVLLPEGTADASATASARTTMKWFDTCFGQLRRASEGILPSSNG